LSTFFAIICAVVASLAFNYAMYAQKKAVGDLPEVKLQLSWSVIKAFLSNGTWLASMLVILFGSALYAYALTVAPISIVQPIMASGVALLAYLAVKNLGEKPRRIDLVAIGLSILGVILIGVSLAEGLPKDVKHSADSLWLFTAVVVAVSIVIPLAMSRSSDSRKATGLGIACGLLYGTSAVFAKLLLVDWSNQWAHKGILVLFVSVFLIAWAVTLVPAFIILQAALQKGMAIVVVPLMASLSQLVPILIGMVALHEPFPKSPALAAVRIFAFALILVATVILSRRAEVAVDAAHGGEAAALPKGLGASLPETTGGSGV
jgi:drug/metabolite transporter (DMT)-like permease